MRGRCEEPERQRQRGREDVGHVVRVAVRAAAPESSRPEMNSSTAMSRGQPACERQRPGDPPLQPVVGGELADDEVDRDEARVADRRRLGGAELVCENRREEREPEQAHDHHVGAVEEQAAAGGDRVDGETREAERARELRHGQLRVRAELEGVLERRSRDEQEDAPPPPARAQGHATERTTAASASLRGSSPPRVPSARRATARARVAPWRGGDGPRPSAPRR